MKVEPIEKVDHLKAKKILGHFWAQMIGCKTNEIFVHPENHKVLRHLAYWMIKDFVTGDLDPEKGIYLYGKSGSGKSFLMYGLMNALIYINDWYDHIQPSYRNIDYSTLKITAESTRSLSFFREFKHIPVNYDDLGYDERSDTKYIVQKTGARKILVSELVKMRHTNWTFSRKQTHFTANHRIEDIEEIYGSRTSRRLVQMCNVIHWHGDDLSK